MLCALRDWLKIEIVEIVLEDLMDRVIGLSYELSSERYNILTDLALERGDSGLYEFLY
jgi:hypothetical protein